MGKNWAICIGVNQYDNLPELKYARRDAELMREYFLGEAGFEKVYLFTDNSPPIHDTGKPFSSQPIGNRLRRFLRTRFNTPFMSAGDNFWFFFSGHGLRHADRDYLMPSDADPHPDGVEETAISLNWVTERLRRCGADNVVLLLDACRDEQSSKGLGIGPENQKGAIAIASCSPAERSYEIDEIGQGAFTYALLEALRIQGEGNCATVERLYQRLQYRVAEINQRFRKPRQTPYAIAEPASKYHLILLPRQATLGDIDRLKKEALTAEVDGELNTAEALTIRVLAISPADPEALTAYKRIVRKSWGQSKLFQQPRNQFAGSKGQKSASQLPRRWKPIGCTVTMGSLVIGLSLTTYVLKQPLGLSGKLKYEPRSSVNDIQLKHLLKAKQWQEADAETEKLMLEVGDLDKNGSISIEEMDEFSCSALEQIDRLWVHYSQGRFGFSIQQEIYQSLGGTRKFDSEIWNAFGDRVGWRVGGEWLSSQDLTETANSTAHSKGLFPVYRYDREREESSWDGDLFSRIEACRLNPASSTSETESQPNLDYTLLKNHLNRKQWKEADVETEKLILEAGARGNDSLSSAEIDRFSCQVLKKVDQLWADSSQGNFGFTVQKEIYQNLGGTRERNEGIWNTFGDWVGWRVGGEWLYEDFVFDLSAERGHLPSWQVWDGGARDGIIRVITCGLHPTPKNDANQWTGDEPAYPDSSDATTTEETSPGDESAYPDSSDATPTEETSPGDEPAHSDSSDATTTEETSPGDEPAYSDSSDATPTEETSPGDEPAHSNSSDATPTEETSPGDEPAHPDSSDATPTEETSPGDEPAHSDSSDATPTEETSPEVPLDALDREESE